MDFNEYLKRLEQFQKQMDRLYEPLKDQSRIISQHLDPFKSVMADQMSTIENSLAPAIEVTKQYQMLMNQISIDVPNLDYLQSWQQSIERLANSPLANLNDLIPDTLYDSLLDLGSELEKVQEYQEGDSEKLVEITVSNQPDQVLSKNNMTWDKYLTILIMVVQLLMQYQEGIAEQKRHEERLATERLHHEEKMSEERKQTDALMRLVEIQEQNPTEIQLDIIHEKIDVLINESLNAITENPTDQVEDSND